MPLAANPFLQTPAVAASKAATGKAAQPDVEPVKTGGEPFSRVYAKASDATSGVTSSKPAITRDASNNSAANPPSAVADSGNPLPVGKAKDAVSTDQVFRILVVGQELIQQLVGDGMLRLAHGVSGSERQCRS